MIFDENNKSTFRSSQFVRCKDREIQTQTSPKCFYRKNSRPHYAHHRHQSDYFDNCSFIKDFVPSGCTSCRKKISLWHSLMRIWSHCSDNLANLSTLIW